MSPTKISFETRYADDSGTDKSVEYESGRYGEEITIISNSSSIRMRADDIQWFIEALCDVRDVINKGKK